MKYCLSIEENKEIFKSAPDRFDNLLSKIINILDIKCKIQFLIDYESNLLGFFQRHNDDKYVVSGPPNKNDYPIIFIYLKHNDAHTIEEWNSIIITLCHEVGHFKSYKDGYWSNFLILSIKKFKGKITSKLSRKEYKAFLDEEKRAWKFAHEKIEEFLPELLEKSKEQESQGLSQYRMQLDKLL